MCDSHSKCCCALILPHRNRDFVLTSTQCSTMIPSTVDGPRSHIQRVCEQKKIELSSLKIKTYVPRSASYDTGVVND